MGVYLKKIILSDIRHENDLKNSEVSGALNYLENI